MARKKDDNPIIVSQRSAQLMAEYIHQGPLPAPMDFAAYGDVLPDAPERILAMAEKEQEHRHQKDNEQIQILKYQQQKESRESMIGLISGIIFVGIFFLFGCYLIIIGKSLDGWISIGSASFFVIKAMIDRDKINKNDPAD